jgi:hypothetical protein
MSESSVLGIPEGDMAGDTRAGAVLAVVGAVLVVGVLLLVRFGTTTLVRDTALPEAAIAAAPDAFDPSTFLLNALLVPALDDQAVPYRWVDPRPAMGCAHGSSVKVDRMPLEPGALVPVTPFLMDWQMLACRPFGAAGPQFTGRVRLTVYREDWGFSASVEPAGFRIFMPDGRTLPVHATGASTPASGDGFPEKGAPMHWAHALP